MRLSPEQCQARLQAADHGVLSTVHGQSLDAVPVCFVSLHAGSVLASPVDRVKAKTTTQLARLSNLERNPRAVLLCEHWDRDDWWQLWWVRAHLRRRPDADLDGRLVVECETALREKYAQYRETEFAQVIVFAVERVVGWAAGESAESGVPPPG